MNSCISQKFKKLKTYLCTTVTMDKAIKFLTSMRPSSLSSYRSTCEQNMASLQKLQSLFWWPKSWSHRCQHMWIILLCGTLTFMNSSNPLLLLLPLLSHFYPLTLPPSPASPPPRLTVGWALPKSREYCPRLGLGFGLLPPPTPLQASAGIWKYSSLSFFERGGGVFLKMYQ